MRREQGTRRCGNGSGGYPVLFFIFIDEHARC